MEENILIDNINIKTLPELILNFLRSKQVKTNLNSIRVIYSIILGNISEEIKDSYLNKITKYLSSEEQMTILIFDDINNGIYDKELEKAIDSIYKELNKTNCNSLYNDLFNYCYFIHFEDEELDNIKKAYKKEKKDFLYLLFKHAIKNYKVSTPKILANRLYNDAKTLVQKAPLRKNLFKMAADLGHQQSALEYGTIVSNNKSESLIYLLKAKELSSALWKIGFRLEHAELTKEELKNIKLELKDILIIPDNYIESSVVSNFGKNSYEKECLFVAFKIYFYLANNKNFSKGYNSLGKLFLNNKLSFLNEFGEIDVVKNKEYAIKWLKKAISLSNIHAMQNLAIYYDRTNTNKKDIKPLLTIGAKCEDLISCVELSKILMEEKKVDEAISYLLYASSQNDSYASYNLGKIYENKFDYDEAKKYYKLAIKNGLSKVSIDLALTYFQEYIDSNDDRVKNSYLTSAIRILESHLSELKEEDKLRAMKLLDEWKLLNNIF